MQEVLTWRVRQHNSDSKTPGLSAGHCRSQLQHRPLPVLRLGLVRLPGAPAQRHAHICGCCAARRVLLAGLHLTWSMKMPARDGYH